MWGIKKKKKKEKITFYLVYSLCNNSCQSQRVILCMLLWWWKADLSWGLVQCELDGRFRYGKLLRWGFCISMHEKSLGFFKNSSFTGFVKILGFNLRRKSTNCVGKSIYLLLRTINNLYLFGPLSLFLKLTCRNIVFLSIRLETV